MAKVTFSCLIDDFRGRLNGDVFSFQRGVRYIKSHNPNPADYNTAAQQFVRGNFSYFTGKWYSLFSTYQSMWNKYAGLINPKWTGFNAYLRTNLILSGANHPDLVPVLYPPPTPSSPRQPAGFTVVPVDSKSNLISWNFPTDTNTYIQAKYNLSWNYYKGSKKRAVIVSTVRADVGSITHSHDFDSGYQMIYKLLALDKWGRVCPPTHEISITIP